MTMSFGRDESFGRGKINTAIIILGDLRMDRFVRKIDQKRFIVPPLDELQGIPVENISSVAGRLDGLAVFVDVGVEIGALSFETHPPIKAWSRRVVITHVPFSDESCFVARLMQKQRKGDQLMTGSCTVNVVGDAVSMRVFPGHKAGTRWRAEGRGHEGVAKHRTFSSDAINVRGFDKRMP